MIRPFGIVHTGIVLDDYVTSTAGLSLSIAGASMWKPLVTIFVKTKVHFHQAYGNRILCVT